MGEESFEELLTSIGVKFGVNRRNAIISNAYGEFQVHLKTGMVLYRPTQCSYCEESCNHVKRLCIVQRGLGWSNASLSYQQLLILAKIHAIREEQFAPAVERQITDHCLHNFKHFILSREIEPNAMRTVLQRNLRNLYARRFDWCFTRRRMQEQEAPSPESEAVAHRRIQKQEQELFEYAMVHLKGLCTVLGVPEGGKKRAIRIYRRAVEKHLMAGHSIEGMAGGAILLACHEQNIPLQVDDLAQHSCASTRDIRRCYQLLLQSFHAPRFFSRFF